ncbi:MAG: zinc ribbon domain-containing protein [Pseudomonadales bacterium]|nr:zinc ribbon domain-containing protein [Pseudomonadales bacterium]RZV56196.1 MAG: zinc ribbon domain-containing protein [Pseudomonadales bacterium]
MPIYEYQCKACAHKLEALQKMADAPLVECPNCAQPELQKLVSAAAFKLKGTGWYETDFKKKGAAESKGDANPASATGDNSGASADAAVKSVDKTPSKAAPVASSSPASA